MPESQTEFDHLTITVAHHDDNEFYNLARVMPMGGGAMLDWNGAIVPDVTHEVPPTALYAALVDASCPVIDGRASHEHMCVMLDACDADGDILGNKEITVEDADRLLDGQFEQRLATARGNLADYYALSTSPEPTACGQTYRDRNGDTDTCSFPAAHEGSCW